MAAHHRLPSCQRWWRTVPTAGAISRPSGLAGAGPTIASREQAGGRTMETLFRRRLWLIDLAALVVVAVCVAYGVTTLLRMASTTACRTTPFPHMGSSADARPNSIDEIVRR